MPPKRSNTPSRTTRATSQGADAAPARTPSRRGGRTPSATPPPTVPGTQRSTRRTNQGALVELSPTTNRTRLQSAPQLSAVTEEQEDEEEEEEEEGEEEEIPEDDGVGFTGQNVAESHVSNNINVASSETGFMIAQVGTSVVPGPNITSPTVGSVAPQYATPSAGVRTAQRAWTPEEIVMTPELEREFAAFHEEMKTLELPQFSDDDDEFPDLENNHNEGGQELPSVQAQGTAATPPTQINPFPSRSGSGASNQYSNHSSPHGSLHPAMSRTTSRSSRNSRSSSAAASATRRPRRRKNAPPGGDPPVDAQTAAVPPWQPLTLWECFLIECFRGFQYLSWRNRIRWTCVLTVESFIIWCILCSAGPICEQYSMWTILWRYLWQDDWWTSLDFICRLVLYAMLLSQIFDCLVGMFYWCFVEIRRVRFDNPGRNERILFWYSVYWVRDVLSIIYSRCLEPLVILAVSIQLNYKAGPGDGVVACAIMLGVHVGKWAVQAVKLWDRVNFGANNTRWWDKRLFGCLTLIVMVLYNQALLRALFTPSEQAVEFNRGGIRHRTPTPTEVKHPVFVVTRITSVTGDVMTVLNSILSASGLSPMTTGR